MASFISGSAARSTSVPDTRKARVARRVARVVERCLAKVPADRPASAEEVHAVVERGFLYEGYQRWFPVIFYFLVLGPAWAVAYRLLQLCRRDLEPALIERCLFFADWIPVRLLAAAFAITGDFVGSRDELLRGLTDTSRDGGELLLEVATAAARPGGPAGESVGGPRRLWHGHCGFCRAGGIRCVGPHLSWETA